ncbi:MAG TPA: hypothetical protein VN177_09825 [Myxococcales bacterium]|nr:hypothetical protein [Myxococcales bacterium]
MGLRRAPFAALLAVGAGSLLFDLTLPFRLPSDADWAEAAGALRARVQPGNAVQLWPAWAERARLFVDAMPVLAEEDLQGGDYAGVRRLWVLSLPRTPFFSPPDAALRARGATPAADEQRFGALALRPWDLTAAPIASDLTRSLEEHEVDYVPRRCVRVPIGGRFAARGMAGTTLHVRGGVIGEHAYDADRPEIAVQIFADGAPLGSLQIPRTVRDGSGWRRLDIPLPPGAPEREFVFAVSSADRGRAFCLQAWTSG